MPLTPDPDTGEVSNVTNALETTSAQANEPSLMQGVQDAVFKGLPLTAMAAVNSFGNTAIELNNWFKGDNTEKWSIAKEAPDIESVTGQDGLNDYYDQHQQGIEFAGFALGSLLPGTAAVKGLKLAQAGEATSIMARATNIFNGPKLALIKDAEEAVQAGDASLMGGLQASKMKAIAYGAGDQALQALTFQLASVATQKASPLLDNESWQNITSDMFYGTLTGAGVGGLLEGIGIRSQFNKMMLNADVGTKPAGIMKLYGAINLFPGDRMAEIVKGLADVPTQTSMLGQKQLATTTQEAILKIKNIATDLVPDGEEPVAKAFTDSLLQMRQNRGLSIDDSYMLLGRLAKISRIGTEPDIADDSTFFVNRFADDASAQWNDLVTSSPHENAQFSQKYAIKNFSNDISIARGGDTVSSIDSKSSISAYTSAEQAWQDGHDLFINKGRVYVNPNAPNIDQVPLGGQNRTLNQTESLQYASTGQLPDKSKPLFGAPLVLNTKTGTIADSAIPVVGDIGNTKLLNTGISYGDKFSPQSLTTPLTSYTATIDANARYVWAAERGVKFGDKIDPTDIPMLEQLYRQTQDKPDFQGYMTTLAQRGVEFTDGSALPASSQDLLNSLQTQKTNLLHEVMDANPKMGAEEAAIRANVSQDFIQNNFQARTPNDLMIDPAQYKDVNHVQLEYNLSNLSQPQGQILRGMQDVAYRIQLGKDANQSQAANFFGPTYDRFILRFGSDKANILGANGKFLAAANGDYDTLAQETERVGSIVPQLSNQRLAAISEKLAPVANALRADPEAAAHTNMFVAVRQRTGAKYSFLPDSLAAKYKMDPNTAVLNDSFVRDKSGNIIDWNKDYVPNKFIHGDELVKANASAPGNEVPKTGQYSYYVLPQKTADWETAMQDINDPRLEQRNAWYAAQGLDKRIETGTLYAPPIDTSKYQHFAYVRTRPGFMMGDDSVSVITAASHDELQNILSSLDPSLSAYTKDQLADLHKSGGDYEFQRNFSNSRVDSSLARKGILNNIFPDTRADTLIANTLSWQAKQELSIIRDHVELANAQTFAELEQMGKRFISPATSMFGRVSPFVVKTADNPYDSYIKSALNISSKEQYPLWQYASEKLEAFGNTAFNAVRYAFGAAKRNVISYEDASGIAAKYGLGNPYSAAVDAMKAYEDIANKLPEPKIMSKIVSVANSVIGTSIIKLDTFQQLIHMVSTPMLTIGEGLSATKQLRTLMSTELPDGSGRQIPSVTKVLFNSIGNFFNKDVQDKWAPLYNTLGVNRNELTTHMNIIEDLALPLGGRMRDAQKWISSVTDKAATISGSNFSQSFLHFVAADTGRQIFEAAGYEGKALLANIQTFANRVQGNYIASQRPVAFQGPIGQAIGLFQTYYFNYMQQLMRYVGNGDAKIAGTVAALNTSIFGLQSLPGFHILNNSIIGNAAGNPGHDDLYSSIAGSPGGLFDRKLGNWLLYGTLSNVLNASLYSRGDLNPRQTSILPINPLEYPAIRGAIQFGGSLIDMTKKINAGGSVPASMLMAMEHNGLSRPLAGLAQLIQGYSTDSKGGLISNNRAIDNTGGMNDVFNMANFSRLLGARPLDEAINLDALYRSTMYQAVNTSRMQELGSAVKSTLIANGTPSSDQLEDFASGYAAAGGDIKSFGRSMLKWTTDANASVANNVFRTHGMSPLHQQMQRAMGGISLPDYTQSGSIAGSNVQSSIWNGEGENEEGVSQ